MAVLVQRVEFSFSSDGTASGSFVATSLTGLGIGAVGYVQSDTAGPFEVEVRQADTDSRTIRVCPPGHRNQAVDLSDFLSAENAFFLQREGLAYELVETTGGSGAVDSVNGQTGIVVLDETDVGADAAGAAAAAVAAHAGTGGATHATANGSANGFMTASDFSKLAALPSKPGTDGTFSLQVAAGTASYVAASSSTAAAGSTGQIQYNNADALEADALLFWDQSNKRLGVNEAAPLTNLHVNGDFVVNKGESNSGVSAYIQGLPALVGTAKMSLALIDHTTQGSQEPGPGIAFGGKYNAAGSYAYWAFIKGVKDTGTYSSDTMSSALAFYTRNGTDAPVEQFRINHLGNVSFGATQEANEKATIEGVIALQENHSPSHTAGFGKLYVKSDGNLYFKDSAGTEIDLTLQAAGAAGNVQLSDGSGALNSRNELNVNNNRLVDNLDTQIDGNVSLKAGVNVYDSFIKLAADTNATFPKTGGVVVTYNQNVQNRSVQSFVAGVDGVSQPKVVVNTSVNGFWSPGNFLQISEDPHNDGIFEIESISGSGTDVFLKGVGTVDASEVFSSRQVVAHSVSGASVFPVSVSALRSSSGAWQVGNGSSGPLTYSAVGGSNAAGSSGAVQFNESNALAADVSEFFWDNSTKQLRIGPVSALAAKVDVDAGTLTGSNKVLRIKGTLPNNTSFNEAFQALITSAGTSAINGCRGGLFYLGAGYSGNADVNSVVFACEAVSGGASTDPILGTALDCGAAAVLNETYGASPSGINMGSHNFAAMALLNIGARSFAGFPGFANNGFVQDSINIASLNSVSLTKHASSSSEKHIGTIGNAAGGDTNIGVLAGLGLTRSRIAAYSGKTAALVADSNGSSPIALFLVNGSEVGQIDASGAMGIGASPTSTLKTGGSFATNIRTITSSENAEANDHTIIANAAGGAITVTLPAPSSCPGRIYAIKKSESSGNAVTVNGNGVNIDFAGTATLSAGGDGLTVQSDGTQYWIISRT